MEFPSPLVTIAYLADSPSQSDSLIAFQCFTSGVLGPLENRLIHLSIPVIFVICAAIVFGLRCCHIHVVLRRRHAQLWTQITSLSKEHDIRIQKAMSKLSFRARLFHELEDQVRRLCGGAAERRARTR